MKKIMRWLAIVGQVVSLEFVLSGCNHDTAGQLPHSVAPAKASVEIEKLFANNADSSVKDKAKAEVAAFKNQQYDVAFGILQELISSGKLTPREDLAVRNAILGLNEALIRAKAAGDPKAAEMLSRLEHH
jgi:hypothetical protein